MLDESVGRLIAHLGEALEAVAPPQLVAAWIFGSRAEARAHRESDLDVGVLFARDLDSRGRFAARLRLAAELPGRLGGQPVDVVVLNDAPPILARRIVLDGIRVLCRDAAVEHAFRRDTMLRAADLEPFLQRMRRLTLEALAR